MQKYSPKRNIFYEKEFLLEKEGARVASLFSSDAAPPPPLPPPLPFLRWGCLGMGQLSLEGYISSFETLQPDNARENEASESFSAPCADPPRAKLQILHPFARVNTSYTLAPSSLLARPSQSTKNDFGVQQEHGTLVRPDGLFANRVQEVFQTRPALTWYK